jgi:hypothetical protein
VARTKYLLEIIRITSSKHVHLEERTNDLFFDITDKLDDETEITINVEPKDLYEVPHNFISRGIAWMKTGQEIHYLMVVNDKGKPIKEKPPAISGKVLRVARDWKGLGRAISDSFGSDLPMGRIAMVGALIIGIGLVAFLIWKGWIPTPESWGL